MNWSVICLFLDFDVEVVVDIVNDLRRLLDWGVLIVPVGLEVFFVELWLFELLVFGVLPLLMSCSLGVDLGLELLLLLS